MGKLTISEQTGKHHIREPQTCGARILTSEGWMGRGEIMPMAWVQIPAPPFPSLVTLARCFLSLNLSLLSGKMGILMTPTE